MLKHLIFVGERPIKNNHAGNKARLDIDSILSIRYGKPIVNFDQIEFKTFWQKISYIFDVDTLKCILKCLNVKNKYVILQIPSYFNIFVKNVLENLIGNNKTIMFVHDTDALRNFGNDMISNEVKRLNKADIVILHNPKMEMKLRELGLKNKVVNIELFDYLLNEAIPQKIYVLNKEIAFAGNLGKSEFLKNKELKKLRIKFNLYGPNFDKKSINVENVEYCGSFGPDEIPYRLKGSFGLIWDGGEIDTCSGPFGNYMRYNNPHKLSLYIAAGLPVIVWEEAAIADFVRKYDIGFTIKSLFEISSAIEKTKLEKYEQYKENILMLQKNVTAVYYTKKVLDQVEKIIEERC